MEDRRVNVQHIQSMVNKKSLKSGVDVTAVMKKCGSTGIDPNFLATCYQISTFFRCIFENLRQLTSMNESDLTKFFSR